MTPPHSVEAWAACGEHGGCDVFSPDCPYCGDNRRNFIDYAAEQVAQARAEEREACAKRIPMTWLDPLLSGKDAVLKGYGPWGGPEIERLLRAIAAAIRERK